MQKNSLFKLILRLFDIINHNKGSYRRYTNRGTFPFNFKCSIWNVQFQKKKKNKKKNKKRKADENTSSDQQPAKKIKAGVYI